MTELEWLQERDRLLEKIKKARKEGQSINGS
jgi:hypothetical protein